MTKDSIQKIGIIGGGPAALFMLKRMAESGLNNISLTIFEAGKEWGNGMPYSSAGALPEHITNVSGNEIPQIVEGIKEWLPQAPAELITAFEITEDNFNDYKVVPRLFFGTYLSQQFYLLQQKAGEAGIPLQLLPETRVVDIKDQPGTKQVTVTTSSGEHYVFDQVIICTGHTWPKLHEGKVPGWFDSPYPPAKLQLQTNFPVAVKGASLTAIDAIRTLARQNGHFTKNEDHTLTYHPAATSPQFKLHIHAIGGLLPAVRFHLHDTRLSKEELISVEEMQQALEQHNGFIPLDHLFDRNFKKPLQQRNPEFFEKIKDMSMEAFVAYAMTLRETLDPLLLLHAEYREAETSIRSKQPVDWKEELATLSYALNYPAKHFSAEDMLRLKSVLMPLVSIIIAFVPQSSVREFMALHQAGVLTVIPVDHKSRVVPGDEEGATYAYTDEAGNAVEKKYKVFIDATGQKPVLFNDFPFKSLKADETVSPAWLKFQSAEKGKAAMEEKKDTVHTANNQDYYLQLPGVQINDWFQVLDKYGAANERLYIMAVPLIAGINPDYSGLDFCERASEQVMKAIQKTRDNNGREAIKKTAA